MRHTFSKGGGYRRRSFSVVDVERGCQTGLMSDEINLPHRAHNEIDILECCEIGAHRVAMVRCRVGQECRCGVVGR